MSRIIFHRFLFLVRSYTTTSLNSNNGFFRSLKAGDTSEQNLSYYFCKQHHLSLPEAFFLENSKIQSNSILIALRCAAGCVCVWRWRFVRIFKCYYYLRRLPRYYCYYCINFWALAGWLILLYDGASMVNVQGPCTWESLPPSSGVHMDGESKAIYLLFVCQISVAYSRTSIAGLTELWC